MQAHHLEKIPPVPTAAETAQNSRLSHIRKQHAPASQTTSDKVNVKEIIVEAIEHNDDRSLNYL